jgi:3-hydroxyisobutyrate dehydrogenase-like beta-hydroxyacid dehydrogenase
MSYCCRIPAEVRELSMHDVKDLEMALDLARAREMQEENAKQVALLVRDKQAEGMKGDK